MAGTVATNGEVRQQAEVESSATRLVRSAPVVAFVVVELLAFAFYLVRGRGLWFTHDEWDFLANRTAGDINDVLGGHTAHPSMLPILCYRLLWHLFGLHTYTPYQMVVIALHLGTAALLRAVMVRSNVQPWLATAAASAYALFAVGWENIIWPFQIGWAGALFFGLAALLLADHDGRFERRDAFAFAAAFASLACSNVGVAMVASVAVAVLLRRGWRAAAVPAIALAAIYVAWWAQWGHKTYQSTRENAMTALPLAGRLLRSTVIAFTQSRNAAVVLVAIFAIGVALAARVGVASDARTRFAAPLGLLVGACVFTISTALERSDLVEQFSPSRYLDAALVFLLPALAVGVGLFARLGRSAYIIALVLLVVGVPSNVMNLDDTLVPLKKEQSEFRHDVLAIPTLSDVNTIDPNTTVFQLLVGGRLPLKWLLASAHAGKVPGPVDETSATRAFAELRLSLRPAFWGLGADHCQFVSRPTHFALPGDQSLVFGGRAEMRPDIVPVPKRFILVRGGVLTATRESVHLLISPYHGGAPPKICAAAQAWQGPK